MVFWNLNPGGAPGFRYAGGNTESTYFEFEDEQTEEGAPMGSPLSPVLADLYTQSIEEMAIEAADRKPSLWKRYVDGTFVIWPHGRETLDEILAHINPLRNSM